MNEGVFEPGFAFSPGEWCADGGSASRALLYMRGQCGEVSLK